MFSGGTAVGLFLPLVDTSLWRCRATCEPAGT